MKDAIQTLAEAVGYPARVPPRLRTFVFRVDGGDVVAKLYDGRLILSRVLDRVEDDLPRLAAFAAGRLLREEATLAWDAAQGAAVLWQDAPEDARPDELRHLFETFADACDWWLARAGEMSAPPNVFPDLLIRP